MHSPLLIVLQSVRINESEYELTALKFRFLRVVKTPVSLFTANVPVESMIENWKETLRYLDPTSGGERADPMGLLSVMFLN